MSEEEIDKRRDELQYQLRAAGVTDDRSRVIVASITDLVDAIVATTLRKCVERGTLYSPSHSGKDQ